MTERVIVLVDTLLVCLGLTMTVAVIGPLLDLATARISRRRARPLRAAARSIGHTAFDAR